MSEEVSVSAPTSVNDLLPKMELKGIVKRIELYGAFVDIGVGQDALLHISQLGAANVRNVGDIVKEGDEITVYVMKVDAAQGKVALTMVKPPDFSWDDLKEGATVQGKVVRVEGFGVFVDIGAERPGMIHVSELSDNYVSSPSDVVKIGDVVQARIIKINRKKRQIDLSMKTAVEIVEIEPEEDDVNIPTAMELALRQAMTEEKGSVRNRRENRDRDRRERMVREREEIIARTLKNHSN
ncbi:MAG: S1 RNA-binding domain-containing protein [Anaerolineae bacterium]|nr:S1 RNA-binding domain-containing protein [Anaerolineae bacterium]